jgi:DNA replication and repair protein RecF
VLRSVEIANFRCIELATLELDSDSTGVIGANASGKTSLLEAIYFLGHGRSFRTNRREKLQRSGAPFLRVVGKVETSRGVLVAGVEASEAGTRAHLGGQGVPGISDIAEVLPLQVIDPGVHRLIEEGSARRRRLLDWGVFHVKHELLGCWRRYQRALQQRNAALRHVDAPELVEAWEEEMASAGTEVDLLRQAYVELLRPVFQSFAARLVGPGVTFGYRRGWSGDHSLPDALDDARARDLRIKTTTVGPHRADLTFSVDGSQARDRVSRGQQKMLAAAFILAQVSLRARGDGPRTILMLDDPAAELDVDNLGKLLAVIAELPAQLIVTSVHEGGLQGIRIGRRFHVEQGRFAPML